MAMAESDAMEKSPPPGKVKNVCQDWLVHEDGALAHRLQEQEFGHKYDWNRKDRKTARTDVPLAKVVHSAEEERLQKERYEFLERQRELAEADALVAKQVQDDEMKTVSVNQIRAEADELLARNAHEEEIQRANREYEEKARRASEDALIASRVQQQMAAGDSHLTTDQEIARKLQEQEKQKYLLKMKERELRKARQRLEQAQNRDSISLLPNPESDAHEPSPDAGGLQVKEDPRRRHAGRELAARQHAADDGCRLREDGKLEDQGDFSDFYIQPNTEMPVGEKKELQEIQDEELARLLQDQEFKRGGQIKQDKLRTIEQRDAELAQIIQEQEKVKLERKKQLKKQQRQLSAPAPETEPLPATHSPRRERSQLYQNQNEINEHRHVSQGRRSPPLSSYALYQTRPLPETPNVNANDWESSLERALSNHTDPTPSSPAPPGYQDPPKYRGPQLASEENSAHRSSSRGNLFTAIDPTSPAAMPPDLPPGRAPAPPPLTAHQQNSGGDDSYADLDDVNNFTPVQGQRRSSKKSQRNSGGGSASIDDKKKSNCKQQ
ncbi:hypothetical protein CAPTEDRAFT_223919 [Capitella teleta]|uniref:Coiled-coil domain-containing protein n=1 Tax=Capitella teleta TaxID=283909 RepID=R7VAV9_CAPTE|nr:hypothetical protein CAPTEDRAFT_223919 [Capitella teleta]|eukprot:ELU15729.1 hypothetical protein CAPTEDRAFT_223919 [Capitella teleta]